MTRSTVRFLAFAVLALLSTPVAMHIVLHDLLDHHHERATASVEPRSHDDHEHPIVSSPASPAPARTRVALPMAITPNATCAAWTRIATTDRNVIAHGALRMDDDVGLQPLLSTFLI